MSIDLSRLAARNPDHLEVVVRHLETAIANGAVPNKLVTDAKFSLNREFEKSAEAFLASGPHAQNHNMSDWWLAAYEADALASGLHTLPAVLRRTAQKPHTQYRGDLTQYAAFLTAWLPVRELLEEAKPMIKKRGELPVVRTAKQIADDADRMTCQCCGRPILANTGTIAHHGYERPGEGWQTSSCMGAKHYPFEVSRDTLGKMIEILSERRAHMITGRDAVQAELVSIDVSYTTGYGRDKQHHSFAFTRENFDSAEGQQALSNARYYPTSFTALRDQEVARRSSQIASLAAYIIEQRDRFEGWKQTHKRLGVTWVRI